VLDELPRLFPAVFVLLSLSMLPFVVMMTTSFMKISITLSMLKNAIGVQQAPTGFTINSIAMVLTTFIIAPVWLEMLHIIEENNLSFDNMTELKNSYSIAHIPLKEFLDRFTNATEKEFFISAARQIWPEDMHWMISHDSMLIIVPSFVVTELTRAFEIGFLFYLPFVVIDMVVSNILLALGAMMVPPTLFSLPAKLFLFVSVDGWARVLHGLMISYA